MAISKKDSTFTEWLNQQSAEQQPASASPGFSKLKEFVAATTEWPAAQSQPGPYIQVILDKVSDASERTELMNTFVDYFAQWRSGQAEGIATSIVRRVPIGPLLLILFGAIVGLVLIVGIFFGDFIGSIAAPERARGLITFLFAFCTIATILLIVIATFWIDKDELEDRFEKAKDLVTILIGVLGTVIGFYFGSATGSQIPIVATVAITTPVVHPGDKFTIVGTVSGGKPPYVADLQFRNVEGIDVSGLKSEDGRFSVEIAVPATVKAPITLPFVLRVKDAAGAETEWSGSVLVVPTGTSIGLQFYPPSTAEWSRRVVPSLGTPS